MVRALSCGVAVAVLVGSCSTGPSAGGASGGGFPAKGFAMVADKAKKGDNALDQALLTKANEVQKQIVAAGLTLKDERKLKEDERAKVEGLAKAAGFADIGAFYKASDALEGARVTLSTVKKLESGSASDFQKAMAAELVKDLTEADLRFVAGLK